MTKEKEIPTYEDLIRIIQTIDEAVKLIMLRIITLEERIEKLEKRGKKK